MSKGISQFFPDSGTLAPRLALSRIHCQKKLFGRWSKRANGRLQLKFCVRHTHNSPRGHPRTGSRGIRQAAAAHRGASGIANSRQWNSLFFNHKAADGTHTQRNATLMRASLSLALDGAESEKNSASRLEFPLWLGRAEGCALRRFAGLH